MPRWGPIATSRSASQLEGAPRQFHHRFSDVTVFDRRVDGMSLRNVTRQSGLA